jgi:hypothetical protein
MSKGHKWVLVEQKDATYLVNASGRLECRKCLRCGLLWDLVRRETDDGPEELHEFYHEYENLLMEGQSTTEGMPLCDPEYRHDRKTKKSPATPATPATPAASATPAAPAAEDKSAIEELWTPAQKWEAAKQIDKTLDATSMPPAFAIRAASAALHRHLPSPCLQVRYGGMRLTRKTPGVQYTVCKSPVVEVDPFGDVSALLVRLWEESWQRVQTHMKAVQREQEVRCMSQFIVTDMTPMMSVQLVIYVAELPANGVTRLDRPKSVRRRWL